MCFCSKLKYKPNTLVMKKFSFFICCYIACIAMHAQFIDDFSDGDLANNPTWLGDSSVFRVDANFMLQLYNTSPASNNTSIIYTSSESIDNATWKFEVRFNFTPSSSNYARVYLVSNTNNFSGSLNGYLVEIGRSNRKIALCKQTGTTVTELIGSSNDVLNLSTNKAYIEIQRDVLGNWTFSFDTSSTFTNLQTVGIVQDTSHRFSKFSGISCRYTSTRAQHFFFDNFIVNGTPYIDTSAFFIEDWSIENDSQLLLHFSKMIDVLTSTNLSNYSASGNLNNPILAQTTSNPQQIRLTFGNIIPYSILLQLQVDNITDIFGNTLSNNLLPFYRIQKQDIILNEVMINPNGLVDLPAYRYIELYNHLPFPIQLKSWKIHVGSTARVISTSTIPANGYLVITDSAALELYPFIPTAYLQPFFSLSSTGATIRLWNQKNQTIDSISYKNTFYQDCSAAQGGFSIERINPHDFCQYAYNWKASRAEQGGTPGYPNSFLNTTYSNLKLLYSDVKNSNLIELHFNRPITSSVLPSSVFQINNNSITTITAIDANTILLHLSDTLPFNQLISLQINNLQDSCLLVPPLSITQSMVRYQPQENDIVINELFFRTSPSIALPDVQFIELKNRTSFPIQLKNWQLLINNSSYVLPEKILPSDSILIIVRQKEAFQNTFPNALTLYTCDAINLSMSGARVSLLSKEGKLINSVAYSEDWHATNKKNGGWSLELIDDKASCVGKNAWKSSRDSSGGTPGRSNSWLETIIVEQENYITNYGINSQDSMVLYLQKPIMDGTCNESDFILQPLQIHPEKVYYSAPSMDKIYLKFPHIFQAKQLYHLHVKPTGKNCLGQSIASDTVTFQLAEFIEPNDLLVNELLFNPKVGGVDFVEIYNNSEKYIDLKDCYLGNYDTTTNEPLNLKSIHSESVYIAPQSLMVLSTNKDTIISHYFTPNPRKGFWNMQSLPPFSNTEGSVSIAAYNLKVFDAMVYNAKWHFNLLNEVKGASLERIFFHLPSMQSSNWHTAASTVGYATPAYENSQKGKTTALVDQWIVLAEEFISPDLDGYQDQLIIQYKIPEPGYLATFKIITAQGVVVKNLANTILLAKEGTLLWDGLNERGEKAKTGIHVLQVEFFHPNGATYLVKKTFVVASKL